MAPTDSGSMSHARTFQKTSVYRSILSQTGRSPAFWSFVVLYLATAAVYIPIGGSSRLLVEHLLFAGFFALLLLAILPLTAGAPEPAWAEEQLSRRVWWQQISALCIFALLFLVYVFVLFFVLVPLLGRQSRLLAFITLSVPLLLFFVLPTLTLRLLGCSWREMGLTRGYRSGWKLLVICPLPLLLGGILVGMGHLTGAAWAKNIVGSLLQAGLPEEVFFRGLLLTRLLRVFSVQWGLFLGALIFGLFHFAVNLSQDNSLALAFAECILDQMTFGLLLACIFYRTRSLLGGTVLHTLIDSLQI